jgi:transposase
MMGTKARVFAPLCNRSREERVPSRNFSRHLEAKLDLAFVHDLVHDTSKGGGRLSIDPVIFFGLHLVLFFEGIRSEREVVRVAADRLSMRWYLGYDLDDDLPDHSSLSRIRNRYGLAIFRRFFEAIVEQCHGDGLVWSKELYFDATQEKANASLDSLTPRFVIEAHLGDLFADDASDAPAPNANSNRPVKAPASITEGEHQQLVHANEQRHDPLSAAQCRDRRAGCTSGATRQHSRAGVDRRQRRRYRHRRCVARCGWRQS